MQDFRNIVVWQKTHQLALSVYKVTAKFPKDELYGLTSQLRRAAASVPTNIAEGCARGGDAEFARFLQIAMGSASEVDYLLLLSKDLRYLDDVEHQALASQASEIKRMLSSFIQKLKGIR